MNEISNTNLKSLVFKTPEGLVFFDYDEIIYIKADRNDTHFFTVNKKKPLKVIGNLNLIRNSLPGKMFFRCHRSYIINIVHINELKHKSKVLVMSNNEAIPITTVSEKELLQFFLGG